MVAAIAAQRHEAADGEGARMLETLQSSTSDEAKSVDATNGRIRALPFEAPIRPSIPLDLLGINAKQRSIPSQAEAFAF
jgi:hypothetical protein